MEIIRYEPRFRNQVLRLFALFRKALAEFRGIKRELDMPRAEKELGEFLSLEYPIFLALKDENCIGNIVGRVDDGVVWAEALFVDLQFRRKGIGARLYEEIEKIAKSYGQETVYNWIHPNNAKIINFLSKRGYSVLNLIEVRKKFEGENIQEKINVGQYTYDY